MKVVAFSVLILGAGFMLFLAVLLLRQPGVRPKLTSLLPFSLAAFFLVLSPTFFFHKASIDEDRFHVVVGMWWDLESAEIEFSQIESIKIIQGRDLKGRRTVTWQFELKDDKVKEYSESVMRRIQPELDQQILLRSIPLSVEKPDEPLGRFSGQINAWSEWLEDMPLSIRSGILLLLWAFSITSLYGRINLKFGATAFSRIHPSQIRTDWIHIILYTVIPVIVSITFTVIFIRLLIR